MGPKSNIPPGYIMQLDPATGTHFYVNTATGQSSWTLPAPPQKSQESALPPGFISQFDEKYQRFFYVNTATGASQWEKPVATQQPPAPYIHHNHAAPPSYPAATIPNNLPVGFISHTDPASGKTFYINTATGATQWDDPRISVSSLHHRPSSSLHDGRPSLPNRPSNSSLERPYLPHRTSQESISVSLPAGFVAAQDPTTVNPGMGNVAPSQTNLTSASEKPMISLSRPGRIPLKINPFEDASSPGEPINPFEDASAPAYLDTDFGKLNLEDSNDESKIPQMLSSKSPSLSTEDCGLRKLSQSSAKNMIIYWQNDYTSNEVDHWGPEKPFSTVQEAVSYLVFDYLVSIYNLLPQINESSIRLNNELTEVIQQLRLGEGSKDREALIRNSMLRVFIIELGNLKKSFDSDRNDFIGALEHRILRYLVANSSSISSNEEHTEFLESFLRAITSTALNLRLFLENAIVATLDLFENLLQSLQSERVRFDPRYGDAFKRSLKSSLDICCKIMGSSYWAKLFPPPVPNNPHNENKVYELTGSKVLYWTQSVAAPEFLKMESPYSILLDPRQVKALPVYYQAVQAMCFPATEVLDEAQILSIMFCHSPEAGASICRKYGITGSEKISSLIEETNKNRKELTNSLLSPSPSSHHQHSATLPRPNSTSLASSNSLLPLASSNPDNDAPINTRLHPIENPNKIKNWDGTDGF